MIDFDKVVGAAVQTMFAEPITYRGKGAPAFVPVKAIFDRHHQLINQDHQSERFGTSTFAPVLTVRLAVMPVAPQFGDVWTARGLSFEVIDVQPDSYGSADLIGRLVP